MSKLKEILYRKKISQSALARKLNIQREVLNYIINNYALPLPKDMQRILKEINMPVDKVWNKKELDFNGILNKGIKPDTESIQRVYRNLSFRVVTACYNDLFTRENLNSMGFKSLQELGVSWVKNFEKDLEKKNKSKRGKNNDSSNS